MSVRKTLLVLALSASALVPAAAHAWTKAYVINWIEPAFLYGGPESGAQNAKGSDCPNGIQEMDWDHVLLQPYRDAKRVAEVRSPEYSRPGFLSHLGFRGPHKENIYESPTAIPDPGFVEVSGKVALGMDLDDNPNTGFTGVDGKPGIDNGFYKVAGCTNLIRGKSRDGFAGKDSNEYMRMGQTAEVMIVTGDKDPSNDDNVTVGIYITHDRMVKDTSGGITADYSFNIDPKGVSTIFKAKITNGVMEAVDRPKITLAFSWRWGNLGEQHPDELLQSKMRLERQADGSLKGQIGGYRDWFQHYLEVGASDTISAAISENLGHIPLPGLYYALRRNADGLPDANGKMHGISTWYDIYLTPAFVVDPKDGHQLTVAETMPPTLNK